MKLHSTLLAVALLATATASQAGGPATTGALPTPANDIVGLWASEASVKPCGSTMTPNTVRNTLLVEAGGTWIDNARFPPNGVPNANGVSGQNQRGFGLGTWSYHPASGDYTLQARFDWYVDGVYHGYQTVDRQGLLSNDGEQIAGPVRSTRYAANGSTIVELCGSAVSQRLA